jgi:hypothetical protein
MEGEEARSLNTLFVAAGMVANDGSDTMGLQWAAIRIRGVRGSKGWGWVERI